MTAINSNRAIRGPVTAVPVVAGTGVRFVKDVENNRVVAEVDETVLWSGDASPNGTTKVGDLSESINNFEYYEVHAAFEGLYPPTVTKFKVPSQWFLNPNTSVYIGGIARAVSLKPQENNTVMDAFIAVGFGGANLTELYILGGRVIDGYSNGSVTCGAYASSLYHIFKIVGINRIAGGN